jgi:hypothetical protein
MRKLKLSEWASLSEIIGAFAVVFSLLLVVSSLDRNTAAIKAQVGDASYAAVREVSLDLLNNPELFDITLRAVKNLGSLDEAEREKYKAWLHVNLDLWERHHDWEVSGLMQSDGIDMGWGSYFSAWTQRYVTRELWSEIKWRFTNPDFNAQVELALSD